MTWFRRKHAESSKEGLREAEVAVALAQASYEAAVARRPQVQEEAEQVRILLVENGFAPKIWAAMKARRA